VRPDRRHHGVERDHGRRRNVREVAAEIGEAVDGEDADAAAIGQDGEPPPGEGAEPSERFRRGEQFVEIEHAQQTGAAERGVVDRVGTGKRAGVGRGRLGALGVAAGLDHDHRLAARRGARRRHELARIADRFDVEQNGARRPVQREVIEQIAEIDIDRIADGHYGGKADAVRRRPFDEPRGDGAGLRDQSQIAGARIRGGKAGIEVRARYQQAEAIGTDEPQPLRPRDRRAAFGERPCAVAEARRDDDRARRTLVGDGGDGLGHHGRRNRDDGEIGYGFQLLVRFDRADAVDVVIARIDQMDGALKAAQVAHNSAPDRPLARARADHGDRVRRKQFVQTIGRHRVGPVMASAVYIRLPPKTI
jgi:hypothetical protein